MKQYEGLCPATLERIKGWINELGYDVVTFGDRYRIVGKDSEAVREGVDDFGLVLFALGHLHAKHIAMVTAIHTALKEAK